MTRALQVQIAALTALLALGDCSASRSAGADAAPSFAPLRSCETRELSFDGADVIVVSNANARPGSISVDGPDERARADARNAVVRAFGQPSPDPRTFQRQWKFGLIRVTDACGRVILPNRAASPRPQ
jgi:hypothetical protein